MVLVSAILNQWAAFKGSEGWETQQVLITPFVDIKTKAWARYGSANIYSLHWRSRGWSLCMQVNRETQWDPVSNKEGKKKTHLFQHLGGRGRTTPSISYIAFQASQVRPALTRSAAGEMAPIRNTFCFWRRPRFRFSKPPGGLHHS